MGGEIVNITMKKYKNNFWHDVLKHYRKLYMKCNPENGKEFLSEPIHYNLNIIRDKKYLHISKWMENYIVKIRDVGDGWGGFYSYEDFRRKFSNVNTNFLIYYRVINIFI